LQGRQEKLLRLDKVTMLVHAFFPASLFFWYSVAEDWAGASCAATLPDTEKPNNNSKAVKHKVLRHGFERIIESLTRQALIG
jgi:hypothetical protein